MAQAFWHKESETFIRVNLENGKLPIVYWIDNIFAKKYCGYGLILKDLNIILECLNTLKNIRNLGQPKIIKQSLSFYAIITYGKCFAETKTRGIRLNKSSALKNCDEDLIKEHERIIEQRNKYVAHGEMKGFEHNSLVAILSSEDKMGIKDIYENIMALGDIDSQIENFYNLVTFIIKFIDIKRTTLLDKIIINLKDIELQELYDKAIKYTQSDLMNIGQR